MFLQVKVLPYHINDPEFADALVNCFLEINPEVKRNASSCSDQFSDEILDEDVDAYEYESKHLTVAYSPVEFPDAKPGSDESCFHMYLLSLFCFYLIVQSSQTEIAFWCFFQYHYLYISPFEIGFQPCQA